jgi:N-sulfoglucosamine sulfohydrolase
MNQPTLRVTTCRPIPILLLLTIVLTLSATPASSRAAEAKPSDRPNILWITCEDISPHLGCYGDKRAKTPSLDKLASEGVRYTHAFSVSGVCAPSRSALITGMYPTSIGTHHMRTTAVLPEFIRAFPEYLREAGYYCTNNVKTDYNFSHRDETWDESSRTAHWRNRKPGQPFFAVFNLTTTHESRIRASDERHNETMARVSSGRQNPDKLELPPYYPDTPAVRKDWARYYELVTAMDLEVADILAQLEQDRLVDNTIVFFYSDHGVGLPRAKRWLYDSGIRVPLIIRWPGKLRSGTVEDRLVSFVDFGPTVLSLAGVEIPRHMQGKAFLGEQAAEPRTYIYAARDRMDERHDIQRAVRDQRYKYIRNYEPHKPYAQHMNTPEQGPTMRELRRLHAEEKLEGPQKLFMRQTKPEEELYDLHEDPDEVNNLVGSRAHRPQRASPRKRNGADQFPQEPGGASASAAHSDPRSRSGLDLPPRRSPPSRCR